MNVRCPFHKCDYDDDHDARCPQCVRGGITVITCAPGEVDAVRETIRGMDTAADEIGAYAVVIYRGYVLANALPDPVGGGYSIHQIKSHLEYVRATSAHAAQMLAEYDRQKAIDDRK